MPFLKIQKFYFDQFCTGVFLLIYFDVVDICLGKAKYQTLLQCSKTNQGLTYPEGGQLIHFSVGHVGIRVAMILVGLIPDSWPYHEGF